MGMPAKGPSTMLTSQANRMYSVFDFNWHPTVDGQFKDYQRNVPASFATHEKSKHFKLIGSNAVGLPNVGSYSQIQFYNLVSSKKNSQNLVWTIPYSAMLQHDEHLIFSDPKTICIKVHPRFLDTELEDINWDQLIEFCLKYNLALGICTYYSNHTEAKKRFKWLIDKLADGPTKLIFFHSFLDQFEYFYELYGYHPNIMFDTSFSLMRCSERTLECYCDVLNKMARNLCFGTDFPDYNLDEHKGVIDWISGRLSTESLQNFLSKNAVDFARQIRDEI